MLLRDGRRRGGAVADGDSSSRGGRSVVADPAGRCDAGVRASGGGGGDQFGSQDHLVQGVGGTVVGVRAGGRSAGATRVLASAGEASAASQATAGGPERRREPRKRGANGGSESEPGGDGGLVERSAWGVPDADKRSAVNGAGGSAGEVDGR